MLVLIRIRVTLVKEWVSFRSLVEDLVLLRSENDCIVYSFGRVIFGYI